MSLFDPIKSEFKPSVTSLGYDAVQPSPRRRSVCASSKSEDFELQEIGRRVLSSETRDLQRNNTIAAFVCRKHVQYVARADFKCAIPGQKEYNDLVKRFIYHWSRRENCDVSRRHSLKEMLRLIEIHRVVDGDVGILKISNGRLQIVEGDRIRNPNPNPVSPTGDYEWIHGVKVGRNNQAFRYAIHNRGRDGQFQFEREVNAENLILCGYFQRIDQIRGISPIASAINRFKDANEAIEYALAKAKIANKIGIVTKREYDPNLEISPDEFEAENVAIRNAAKEYFDNGVLHFNFGKNDDARLFESQTPANEFQTFMTAVMQEAMISLDIPLNFLKPDLTNFYGSRGALDDYIDSCMNKQEGLINALHEITDWRLRMAIADGELPPPPNCMNVDDLLWYCDWVGTRIPIHRLIDDCKGFIAAGQAGYISPQKVAGIFGQDYDENMDELAETVRMANERGVPSPFAQVNNYGL
jgi:capsid protein